MLAWPLVSSAVRVGAVRRRVRGSGGGAVRYETLGPPFLKRPEMGLDLAWGLACVPIAYDPPVVDPSELDIVTEERAELGPIPITLQREPAQRLSHLSQFPIAVVPAESSMSGSTGTWPNSSPRADATSSSCG